MPETFAAQLAEINNQGTEQQNVAERFMTFYREKLEENPEFKDHPLVIEQIEIFQSSLSEIDEAWARDQLEILESSRDSRNAITRPVARPERGESGAVTTSLRPRLRPERDGEGSESGEERESNTERPRRLSDIGQTPESVATLAAQQIDGYPDGDKIEEWQREHNIGVDGILGIESYGELHANELLEDIRRTIPDGGSISAEHQRQVLKLIEYANIAGTNTNALLVFIVAVGEGLVNNVELEESDEDFFEKIGEIISTYEESEEGQAELERTTEENSDRRSLYAIATDSSMSPTDRMKAIVSDPMLLIGGGLMFLFGVFGSNTKYTDSFIKRLGILLGGVIMGPAVWDRLGVGEALDDLGVEEGINSFFTSTEVRTRFNRGREATSEILSGIVEDIRGIEIDPSGFNASYEAVQNAFIGRQEGLLGSDGEPRIPNETFTRMHTSIMSDAKFLNASVSDVSGISSYEDLTAYLTPETIESLGFDGNSEHNEYVRIYIQEILVPEFNSDHSFVGDIFIISSLLDTAGETFAYNVDNLTRIESDEQRSIIEAEFSNILQISTHSEALKNAAKDLLLESRDGDVSTFIVDNYPSLNEDEKNTIGSLKSKLEFIFSTQKIIETIISEIEEVDLSTREGQLTETKETLENKLSIIFAAIGNLRSTKEGMGDMTFDNIQTTSFDWDSAEQVYNSKRLEIIRHANELGISTLSENSEDIDVSELIDALETEERQRSLEQEVQNLTDGIEVPSSESTPLECKAWWLENKTKFENIEAKRGEIPEDNSALLNMIQTALEKKDRFINNYKESRDRIKSELEDLEREIRSIDTSTRDLESYKATRTMLESISQKYDAIIAKVIPNWSSSISEDIWNYFSRILSDDSSSQFSLPESENSIEFMDNEIGDHSNINMRGLETLIATTIRSLESNITISLDTSSVNVNDTESLGEFKASVRDANEILGFILDDDIREEAEDQLAEQVTEVENLFIVALDAATTENEVRVLRNIYNTEFKDFLIANGNVAPLYRRMLDGGDRVELKIEERLDFFSRADIYSAVIAENGEEITSIVNLLNTFYSENEDNQTIKQILENLGEDQNLTVAGLLEVLGEYTTEGNVLYIENEDSRGLLLSLIELIETEINTLN